jgi:hypothetical protein
MPMSRAGLGGATAIATGLRPRTRSLAAHAGSESERVSERVSVSRNGLVIESPASSRRVTSLASLAWGNDPEAWCSGVQKR